MSLHKKQRAWRPTCPHRQLFPGPLQWWGFLCSRSCTTFGTVVRSARVPLRGHILHPMSVPQGDDGTGWILTARLQGGHSEAF